MATRMALLASLLCLTAIRDAASYTFFEDFDEGWDQRWVASSDEKYQGRFVVDALKPGAALKVPKKAVHYGLTAKLDETFDPSKGVVLQYEARYSSGQTCAGAYLKFYSEDQTFTPADMKADTPYTVMFGPDVCGTSSKVHLILNHKSPKSGEISEKHLKSPPRVKSDKKTHVYTARLNPDNTFEVMVDGKTEAEGSLFEKFEPPVNPPEQIPDPDDKKPSDWVDDAQIDDPDAVKPEDWVDDPMMLDEDAVKPEGWLDDAPAQIADPEAVKPEDWDEEEDGEWTASLIPNPACKTAPGCGEWKRPSKHNPEYKGAWKPPKIDNPAYKGEWKQATIPNPDYYVDEAPLKSMAPIAFVGLELWTMDQDIYFDSILVTQDADLAANYREKWTERNTIEKEEEEAERERNKAERAAAKRKDSELTFLRDLLATPPLAFLEPYLMPAVEWAETQGQQFYIFVCVITAITLSVLMRRCCSRGGSKKKDAVGQRKKEDISQPDDPPKDVAEPSSSAGDPNESEGGTEQETPKKGSVSRRSN